MANHQSHRRRWEQVSFALIAALGIAVLAVAVAAIRHPQTTVAAGDRTTSIRRVTPSGRATTHPATTPARPSVTPTHTSAASPTATAPRSAPAAVKQPLVVLNNTYIQGLAAHTQLIFQSAGWVVSSIGGLQNNILSTCAYFDPAVPGAQAAAKALQAQFPAIQRVEPKFVGLPAGGVVVVLTPAWATALAAANLLTTTPGAPAPTPAPAPTSGTTSMTGTSAAPTPGAPITSTR